MKKDEYIAEVTSGIKSEYVKLEIAAELGGHIDELMDFYLGRGYSETEAEEKAVADMGDGELVGRQLAPLYKSVKWWQFLLAIPVLLVPMLDYLFLAMASDDGNLFSAIVLLELVLLPILLIISAFGHSRKSHKMTFVPVVTYVLYIVEYLFMVLAGNVGWKCFASPVVVSTIYTVLGKFIGIYDAYYSCYIEFTPWVTFVSLLFYIVVGLLLVVSLVSSSSGNRSIKKTGNLASTIIKYLTVYIVLVLTVASFSLSYYGSVDTYNYNGYVILESESKDVPYEHITSISSESKGFTITYDFDWRSFVENMYFTPLNDDYHETYTDYFENYSRIKYDKVFSHYIKTVYFNCKSELRYICIIPLDENNNISFEGKKLIWLDTQQSNETELVIDGVNRVVLKLSDK